MAGHPLDPSSVVHCSHGGVALPTVFAPRVRANGAPLVTVTGPYVVTACPNRAPDGTLQPCASGQFLAGSLRVKAMGQPLALDTGVAICQPTGTPLVVLSALPRVRMS